MFGPYFDKEKIIKALTDEFGSNFQYEHSQNKWAIFCFINNIKVDIIKYEQPLLLPIETIEDIRIINTLDIAAMKINAVIRRANKKDFWDMKELLQHHSLSEIIEAHQVKYPNQMLLNSIPQALSCFDEAEESENPNCLRGYTWEEVKSSMQMEIRNYLI